VNPQILGTPLVGNTLTASNGSWSGADSIHFSYRWLRCAADGGAADGSDCQSLGHATKTFYRVRLADKGSSLRLRVTASATEGTTPSISDATAAVAAPGKQPVSITPPAIVGKTALGRMLTAKTGLTTGARPIGYEYQWRRCNRNGGTCTLIGGASDKSYAPSKADMGHELRVRVIARNTAGTTWSASAPTATVAPSAPATAPASTGEPRIVGTAAVGNTLTATNGSWSGSKPMTFSYRWRRCPKDGGAPDASNCGVIANATGSEYKVRSADAGFRLRVRVTASNSDGSDTSTSNATDTVRAAGSGRPTNTSPPTISGTPEVGQTLTANPGNWSGESVDFAYRWRRCDQNGGSCADISGATNKTYTLKSVDSGNTLRVRVTGSNSSGSSATTSAPTAVVKQAAAPGPGGVINLPGGERSIPVTNVPKGERLIISQVRFDPRVVTSRNEVTIRARIVDTRGFIVRGALVFVRATPRVTSGDTGTTATDGWVTLQVQPLSTFPLKRGAVQFFLRAYRSGDPVLAGISSRRLVQIIVRP
jgi:hypothetical protein